jgi:hypothetical protein
VALDEFQQVARLPDEVQGTMRSRIEQQLEAASYLFAGSQAGLLTALFAGGERPFFGQATPVRLGPLAYADLADYIESRFAADGRDPGRALDALLGVARGHPQRAMLLAHYLWLVVQPGEAAHEEHFETALAAAEAGLNDAFTIAWDGLDANEARVLSAVAAGAPSLFNQDVARRFGLTNDRATAAARDRLIMRHGHLEREGRELRIIDPLFERWLARRLGAGPDPGR